MQEEDMVEESSRLLPLNSEVSDAPQPLLEPADRVAGRTRRKIRLKRRDRDLRVHAVGMAQPFGQARDAESGFLCACRPSRLTARRRSSGSAVPCSATLVLLGVTVTVALLSMAYFAVHLQSQMSVLAMHLEAVTEEKAAIAESNRQLHISLENLHSNYSALKANFSLYLGKIDSFELEIGVMNHSVMQLETTFESFPDLAILPSRVTEMQVETARLGSIVTDLISLINSTESSQSSSITPTAKTDPTNKPFKSINGLMEREIQSIPLYLFENMTKQLELRMQNAEIRLLELQQQFISGMKVQENSDVKQDFALSQMQDIISNVSTRAMSAELLAIDNQSKISLLQKLFHLVTNVTETSLSNT